MIFTREEGINSRFFFVSAEYMFAFYDKMITAILITGRNERRGNIGLCAWDGSDGPPAGFD